MLFDPEKGWRRIEIDDRVPCQVAPAWARHMGLGPGATPCFSQPVKGEVWPLMLEKAFAKVAGSYGALEGGIPEIAFQLLTGQREQLRWQRANGASSWSQLRFVKPGWSGAKVTGASYRVTRKCLQGTDFFLRLAYYDQANFLLAASIDSSPGYAALEHRRRDGLVEGHAYSVLEVQEVHGLKLVRLRNPWGKIEWNGQWSRGSTAWARYPHVAQDIARRGGGVADAGKEDGSFWMSFDDFSSIFNAVIVCPATMPVPKASRYAASSREGAPVCGRCSQPVQSRWLLARSNAPDSAASRSSGDMPTGLSWHRLRDGDLCPLCLRATSVARRAWWAEGLPAQHAKHDIAGLNGAELHRRVPGIDYYPFEAGAGCALPGCRKVCEMGPACTLHSPGHFAEYDHPWMKPGPELVLRRAK
eukprot:TRINITY_DN28414_c0_g2_i1.p1 TRINITY_DN28414_c0_g2~~TRINITY_DN28414_c0_g2_i1.p1  ORF type:complete len:416 (+),score=59.98 TRINITY_DN28414_c0_g2_i1:353-1600(+)